MKGEVISVREGDIDRYEEMLMRRDALRKEAFALKQRYMREFGNLMLAVFRKKMECVRKKKTIEFCGMFANRGEPVDEKALQMFLQREMASWEDHLEDLMEARERAGKAESISFGDVRKIKTIYRRLAKKIHPDINPLAADDPDLREIWDRVVAAYNANDLKELEEAEFIALAILERLGMGDGRKAEIPDIEKKIKDLRSDITRIETTEPYLYKAVLCDPGKIEEKKKGFREELEVYTEHSEELDDILEEMTEEGVISPWAMIRPNTGMDSYLL